MKKIYLLLICLGVNAQQFEPYYEADLPNPAINITKDKDGNFVEVTVNEWHDSVYTKEGNKNYIYRQGYNYKKKQGFIRTFSTDNKLLVEKYSEKYDGMVVREEMLQAFELFKHDPTISKLLKSTKEPITIHGGFNYEDSEKVAACSPGNRCVHVIASTPTIAVLAHAIVKLVDKSVPYPTYDTDPVTIAAIELKMKKIREKRGKHDEK